MLIMPELGKLKQEKLELEAILRYAPRPKTNNKNRNFQASPSKASKCDQARRHVYVITHGYGYLEITEYLLNLGSYWYSIYDIYVRCKHNLRMFTSGRE